MKTSSLSVFGAMASLLVTVPTLAQTVSPTASQVTKSDGVVALDVGQLKQRTDGDAPTVTGPGNLADKQKTDGEAPTTVGPGSQASTQGTESLSHSDPAAGTLKQK
jgi:hypothetical protein